MSSNVGALQVTVQANATPTAQGMAQIVNVVTSGAQRINTAAANASNAIGNIGRAGRTIGRVKGAEEAAASIDKVGHASVGARREMLVLAHELSQGQFKRAAGSFMVLGERMDFMGKLMSPMGLAIGGVALAIGGVAAIAIKGAQDTAKFNNAIVATGNYAGMTRGRFFELTDAVAKAAKVETGAALEITQGLLETGRIGGEALSHVATAAAVMSSVTGKSGEEVVKDFAKMSDGVLKWALEADKQYHFMDGALVDHVKALETNGHTEQAMIVVSDALTAAKKREADQIGQTRNAFVLFRDDVNDTINTLSRMFNIPIEDRIRGIRDALANAPKEGGLLEQGTQSGGRRSTLSAQLSHLSFLKRQQDDRADAEAYAKTEAEKTVVAKEEWAKRVKAAHIGTSEMQAEVDKAKAEGKRAGASQADIDAVVKEIKKSFEHKDAGAAGVERADFSAALQPLERQISAEEKLLAYRERVLNQYHKADLISDQGYHDTRATVMQAAQQRISSLYDQEIAVAEQHAAKVTDARAKIEATAKVEDLRTAKQAALLQISEATNENNFELAQSTEKYREELTKLNAELDKLHHTSTATNARDEFLRQNSGLAKQAKARDDTGTLAKLNEGADAAQAQSDMNDLKTKAKYIEDALTQAEARSNLELETGQKGQIQNMIDISAQRQRAAQELQIIADKMTAVANASGLPELQDQADALQLHVDQLQGSTNLLGKTLSTTFSGAFANSLLSVQNRTRSLKDAFLDMANSIEQALLKLVDADIAEKLFGTGGGSGTNGAGLFGKLVGLAIGAMGGVSGAPADSVTSDQLSAPDWSNMPGRAAGGPVTPNSMYEVNERGPELLTYANRTFLMMGDKGGKVSPLEGGAGGRGSPIFNMNIAVPAGTTRQSAQQQAAEIMRHAQIAQARNA